MADRTAAALFASIFELIDEYVPEGRRKKAVARKYWTESMQYDFSPDQMDCDDTLKSLGLAKDGSYYGEPIVVYRGDPEW